MVLYYHRSIYVLYPVFDPTEFTARKQGAVSDQLAKQDQKYFFSVQAASCKFSKNNQVWWWWNTFRFSSGKRFQYHEVDATLIPGQKADVENTKL